MTFVHVLSVGAALALCALPVLLLRRRERRAACGRRAEEPPSPKIVQNSWIAYALRLSLFVPAFALGAAGDLWPAMAGAVGFAAGMLLLAANRRQVAAMVDGAHGRGEPATLPRVLADGSGGADAVRVAAAAAASLGLVGLAGAEAAALCAVAGPLVGEGAGPAWTFVALLAVAWSLTAAADADGVRYVAQALLAAVYLGLFGSAAFLLYLNAADLRPMPPHGAFALLALAAVAAALLGYRQSKYCETPALIAPGERSRWRRHLSGLSRQLLRIANVAVSVFAVLVVVITAMEFYVLGLPGTLRNGLAAFGAASELPAVALPAIGLLALAYPLADAVSWQGLGALARFARAHGDGPDTQALFRRPVRTVAGETAAMGVVLAAFGALAALATDLPPDERGVPDLVRQLVSYDIGITDAALTLLLVGAFAMALSTTSMALSAATTLVRGDLLPSVRPGRSGSSVAPALAVGVLAAAVAALWIGTGAVSDGFATSRVFVLVLAFASLQLSLAPLVAARISGIAVTRGAALSVIGVGVIAAFAAIAAHLATGDALWLWRAVPACLAAGSLCLAVATRRRSPEPPT